MPVHSIPYLSLPVQQLAVFEPAHSRFLIPATHRRTLVCEPYRNENDCESDPCRGKYTWTRIIIIRASHAADATDVQRMTEKSMGVVGAVRGSVEADGATP